MLQLNENKQFAFFQRRTFPIFLLILVFSIFVIAANILRPSLRTI